MHTFKADGIDWLVKIDWTARCRVKAALGVDLLKCLDADSMVYTRLGTDIEFAIDILYIACQEQAERLGISKDQFGAGLGGDDLAAAMEALVAETIAFFPKERQRNLMAAIKDKIDKVETAALRLANGRLDQLDEAWIEDQMTAAMATALATRTKIPASSPSDSSGVAPASSGSTPPE